jgi:hypothetical protein
VDLHRAVGDGLLEEEVRLTFARTGPCGPVVSIGRVAEMLVPPKLARPSATLQPWTTPRTLGLIEAGDEREEDELREAPEAAEGLIPAGHRAGLAALGDELRVPAEEPRVHERAREVDREAHPTPDPVDPSGAAEEDDPDDEEHHPDLGDPGRDAAGDVSAGLRLPNAFDRHGRSLPSPAVDRKCRFAE